MITFSGCRSFRLFVKFGESYSQSKHNNSIVNVGQNHTDGLTVSHDNAPFAFFCENFQMLSQSFWLGDG